MVLDAIKSIKESIDFLKKCNLEQDEKIQNLKKEPFFLEQQLNQVLTNSLSKALSDALFRNSLIDDIVKSSIKNNFHAISEIAENAMLESINSDDFKAEVKKAFANKLAKTFISTQDSNIEKSLNQLKMDPVFRSKLTLTIATLIEEHKQN